MAHLLEPSFGAGHLLKKFLESNPAYPMTCYELDATIEPIVALVGPAQQVIYADFLQQLLHTQDTFQTIVANPPYVKMAKGHNLYVTFIQRCFDLLTPNGEMVFIVPSDFLKVTSAAPMIDAMTAAGSFTDFWFPHDETLFVGDMEHDIETARFGNIRSCAVLTGYDSLKKLQRALPDHVAQDMFGVMDILRRQSSPEALPPTPTVGALIVGPEEKLLMVHTLKWSGLWGIPGGKIKGGETSEEALHREILEETGLPICSIRFALAQDCIRSKEFYKPAHFVLLNYSAYTQKHHVTLNEEADEYRWCTLAECEQLSLNTPTRILIDWYKKNR